MFTLIVGLFTFYLFHTYTNNIIFKRHYSLKKHQESIALSSVNHWYVCLSRLGDNLFSQNNKHKERCASDVSTPLLYIDIF